MATIHCRAATVTEAPGAQLQRIVIPSTWRSITDVLEAEVAEPTDRPRREGSQR